MNVELFRELMTADMLMGPNSLRILEELFQRYPLYLSAGENVLDLGCGKGLTSYAIAKETEAAVYANDLWIPAEENAKRLKRCVLPLLGRVFFSETNRLSPKEQRKYCGFTTCMSVLEVLISQSMINDGIMTFSAEI